ncbi:MAG: hypothetical protein KGZ83_10005 [Sulfuricella sp.]|nr:hypothetical protein [Sulfuricella sp.]
MEKSTSLDKFVATPFRQEIELQQVDHEANFSTLRVRIREIKRFTIFEIDAATAEHWGKALLEWAATQGESK